MNPRLLIVIAFAGAMFADILFYIAAAWGIDLNSTPLVISFRLTSLICLLILSSKFKWKEQFPDQIGILFKALIFWNLIILVRGIFTAETYWDWKYLVMNTAFTMLIPYAIVTGALFDYCGQLYTWIVKRLFVFGYIAIPLTLKIDMTREFFPRALMVTSSFFVLMIPFMKARWRIVIAAMAIVSVLMALDYRTNVLRIGFALLLVGVYYCRKLIPPALLRTGCVLLLAAPLIFLILGVTGQYNVFKPSEDTDKYDIEYDNGLESNLATDTRTFLYEEVFSSMLDNGSIFFGEGGTAKYKTQYFEDEVGTSKGRTGAEVGFLTALLYTGIIGVVLYASILFSAVYYAIARSNNFFCKMLAVFLAFRWVIFFIEDYFQYDMNCFFLWMAIGLCLSKRFRAMSDADIVRQFSFEAPTPAFQRL